MATQKKVAKKSTHNTKPVKKTAAKKPVAKTAAKSKKNTATKKVVKKASAHKPVKKASLKGNIKKAPKSPVLKSLKKVSAKNAAGNKKAAPKKPVKKLLSNHSKNAATIVKSKLKPSVKKTTAKAEVKKVKHDEKKNTKSAVKPLAKKFISRGRPARPTNKVYQPEFVKSVLDQPEHSGPVFRYSDTELKEFRDIILKKMESAKKELIYLQGLITRKDEAGTEDTESKYMSMEDGSGTMEREQLNQMASRQIQFVDHLEKALMRIENKTYGICRITGKLIDKARLRAVPHATLSIEAKQALNK